ncbi:Mannose-1-phosphate guanylyltransferase 1 [Alphaproteobacteria bacterium SO-S41]|nr:Mannose-1-phosphate guanylyltransferase 1 [Alphaproteobacteria bacterium SO-S41]
MTSILRSAILCGGSGTRLWPLSREDAPKQFHPLVGEHSLLSETVRRTHLIPNSGTPIVLTAQAYAGIAREHARLVGVEDVEIILEPAPRNTAPAAALAALLVAETDPEAVIGLFPSDHHVADEPGFLETVEDARRLAESGAIVTLGIVPDAAHTGYGYIRRGDAVQGGFKVDRFVEKPNAETAAILFSDKNYYWNAGIFFFRADVFLRELAAFRPDILAAAKRAWAQAKRSAEGIIVDADQWAACPSDSIDYAVAERTAHAAVVPADIGWNDVGSWLSLLELASRDQDGNTAIGDVSILGSSGCYVRSSSRHIAIIGASDMIVIETADAILVVHKDATQDVKRAAQMFKHQAQALAAE